MLTDWRSTMIRRIVVLSSAALLLATGGVASAALTPAQKCEIAKSNAVKAKYACLTAQRKKVIAGKTPDTAACETAFMNAFARAENAAIRGGEFCFDLGDATEIERLVDSQESAAAQLLSGAGRFQDNGDGTVTDAVTGLMWEKKSMDGSVHDVNQCFPWEFVCTGDSTTVCSSDTDCTIAGGTCPKSDCQTASPNGMTIFQWVAQLNSATFAGHTDWRIPTESELETIIDYTPGSPSVSPAFNSTCAASCTVTTCSCTAADFYWSSTTNALNPLIAWVVFFKDGSVIDSFKVVDNFVRGVRAGSLL
jgi:hypothetical protein